tara:strand:- start:48 stop:320 length:273 start_codon:yes stop_codon:yes gene_type:complete
MKPTKKKPAKRRLKDVLGDKPINKEYWDIVFGKLKKLGTAIEMYYGGDMDIDNQEYRWVDDRIKYYEKDNRLLSKQEMQIANLYWKKYKK